MNQIIDQPCAECGKEPRAISATGKQYRYGRICLRAQNHRSYRKHHTKRLVTMAKKRREHGHQEQQRGFKMEWDEKNHAHRRDYNREYRNGHLEKDQEYHRKWQQKKRDEGYFRTPEKRAKRQAYYLRVKIDVFEHYGGLFCQCCGVDDLIFLTLDHVAGDGASHRAMLGKMSSQNMYLWIRSNDYPEGFQVLCFNCNHGKHQSKINVCPHQTQRLQLAA